MMIVALDEITHGTPGWVSSKVMNATPAGCYTSRDAGRGRVFLYGT